VNRTRLGCVGRYINPWWYFFVFQKNLSITIQANMSKRNFRKRNEKNQKRAKARDDTNKDNDIEEIVRTDQVGRPQRSQHSSNITISGSSDALATYVEMMAPTLDEMYVFGANNGGPQFMAPPQRLPPPHQDIIAARGAKGGPKNHDKGKDKVNASKPAAATNADAVVLFRKNVPMSQARCPNCRLIGHWLVRCVGPPNIWGFIPGCPWCSDTGHRWQQCSEFPKDNWQEIARILLSVRKNLPPLEFTIAPTDLEHGKPGMKYAGCLPWTTQFATRFHMENPDYWKTHVYHLNQKDDTMIAVDNSWSAEDYPANLQMLVTIPWEGHPVQATRPGPKKRTRRSDDPEASKRQRTDGQPGTDVEVTNFGNTPA